MKPLQRGEDHRFAVVNPKSMAMVDGRGWLDLVGFGWTHLDWSDGGSNGGMMVWRASRGGFTRQAVNVACLEALTKVLPVRLPVRRRQASRQIFQAEPL